MAGRGPNKTYDPIELSAEQISRIEHSEFVPMELVANWTGLLNEGSLSSRLYREGIERLTVVRTEDLLAAFPKPRKKRKYERRS